MLITTSLPAQELKAVARADSTNLLIGSALGLEVELAYPAEIEPLWPIWQDQLGSFLIIDQGEIAKEEAASGMVMKQKLTLMSFDSGYQQIPIISLAGFSGKDTIVKTTKPIGIDVYTIPVDTTKNFHEIIEPLDAPVVFREVLPYLVLAVLLIAIAVFIVWYRRYKARKEAEVFVETKPRILPQLIARGRFRDLEAAKYWQQGDVKSYFSELSNILREYLENRYRILALESTTDEILDDLKETRFPQLQAMPLQSFLETADLAKFAKHKPSPEDCQEALGYAEKLIKETQLATFEELEIEWGVRTIESEINESE
jgi:hypothetical protein